MSIKINTNLQSLLIQSNLTQSTDALNNAIERMTTGAKINHSKDNAANYSISNEMSSKLSSYNIAHDNVAAGLDFLSTAQDTISLMQAKGERLLSLWTQAQNGTYDKDSLDKINSEATAIVLEINRVYNNTKYNGINLLSRNINLYDGLKKAGESGFIDETAATWGGAVPEASTIASYNGFITNPKTYTDAEVEAFDRVQDVETFVSGRTYAIYTADELVKLANFVNKPSGNNTTGVTFVLGADIDLSSYCTENSDAEGYGGWTPIGDYSTRSSYIFKGIFDGNGHKIKGIKINPKAGQEKNYQGLFGKISSKTCIKNLCVEGSIKGKQYVAGIAGQADSSSSQQTVITNCCSNMDIAGDGNYVGGIVGELKASGQIDKSFSSGNITGNNHTGGIVGCSYGTVSNSYSSSTVKGNSYIGGIVGWSDSNSKVLNSYTTKDIIGTGSYTGGIAGWAGTSTQIANCYTTGNIIGNTGVGGIVGGTMASVSDSYSTGTVSGMTMVGGVIGRCYDSYNIARVYSTGQINGTDFIGGVAGQIYKPSGSMNLTNVVSYAIVAGEDKTGSLVGGVISTPSGGSFGEINFTDCRAINQGIQSVGGEYSNASGNPAVSHGIDTWLENIELFDGDLGVKTIQVGINDDDSSRIDIKTSVNFNLNSIISGGIQNAKNDRIIKDFLDNLSSHATEIGATSNRLESALESISVSIDNLTSSKSTIKDADIAKESSSYIRAQILQNAASTLLATSNQNPSIALQLI